MTTQRPRGNSTADFNQRLDMSSRQGGSNYGSKSRAEIFEDEKRRIVESCFGKKDPDGKFSESYITHICITEDGASPSAPPPPTSPPENKKPRVIIIAVKRSGRVRMHKARENSNSTYSIGKTWVLDDLSAIESFQHGSPVTQEERQRKLWAADSGFVVTVQKPYYWQAISSKEKDFFIGSLVKIFKKYTGGKLPLLTGFSDQQLEDLTGQRPQTPPSRSGSSAAPPLRESPPRPLKDPPRDLNGDRKFDSSSESSFRRPDMLGSMPGQFPSSDSLPQTRSQTSRAESPAMLERSQDDKSLRSTGATASVESFNSKQESSTRRPSVSNASVERLRSNGAYSPASRNEHSPLPAHRSPERKLSAPSKSSSPASQFRQEQVPERRRPPLLEPHRGYSESAAPSPSEYMTPTDGPSPRDPLDHSRRNALDDLIMSEGKSPSGYFMDGERPFMEEPESSIPDPPTQASGGRQAQESVIAPALVTSPTISDSSHPETPTQEEVHRPGLGPMIKKKSTKEIASVFRKAALAHNAFKPRVGGAAERLKGDALTSPNAADGINGVFPAPALLREPSKSSPSSNASPGPGTSDVPSAPSSSTPAVIPNVTVTPSQNPEVVVHEPHDQAQDATDSVKKSGTLSAQDDRRRKRPSNNSAKYAKALGIDPILLEDRTSEIESALSDFGWGEGDSSKKSIADLQSEIKRDLSKLETGSWLGNDDHNDERVIAVGRMLDKAIAECEELDGLLTLYNVELGTLTEDVAYIEAQSQGLQVQTANQRLLHSELQDLLKTISISNSQLQILKEASLTKPQGVQAVETSLTQLYKAMLTIDPTIRQTAGRPASSDGTLKVNGSHSMEKVGTEISTMRAVQEKKNGYRRESLDFIQRFKQYLFIRFREAERSTLDSIERSRSNALPVAGSKMDSARRDRIRADLWMYSPLMLFARDIDSPEWEELLRMYEGSTKRPYQEELRDNIGAWKRVARVPLGEEQEVLFTSQERETDGLMARTLTVKRSKALRDGPRTTSSEKAQDGKVPGYEAFAGALFDVTKAIFVEQNFLVDFFHVSSLETTEFPDLVAVSDPESRRLGALDEKRLFDPDRALAKRVHNTMDDMFSSWPGDLQTFVDWVVQQDALHGVGVMFALESKLMELEDSNQEFITQTLTKIHSRLTTRFERFVEEQIRGIEDTKVKIKKRKGVIAFIKTFPYFASAVENMFPIAADAYEVRHMVNEVYNKINKAMFESLKFIAKESPMVMAGQKASGQTGGEAEDKEILNYHILLIENMNHYIEEVEVRHNAVLQDWRDRAVKEMAEHMDLYLSAVIRRPLGKLLDFLESTESLVANSTSGPTAIATRASHSRSVFKKVLSTFDAREIRKGVDTLKKRVEKHFGDADDPSLSRNLVAKVLRACEDRYMNVHDRASRIAADVYEGGLDVEFKRDDVASAFRR